MVFISSIVVLSEKDLQFHKKKREKEVQLDSKLISKWTNDCVVIQTKTLVMSISKCRNYMFLFFFTNTENVNFNCVFFIKFNFLNFLKYFYSSINIYNYNYIIF